MRETLNDYQGLFNCLRPEPVDDCGAFSDEQLNERSEDVIDPCEKCSLEGLSECCNAPIKWTDICTSCGEHTESCCENCNLK